MKKHDWVIVGAGFTGSTLAERISNELKQSVLLIDQRAHIAGNAYDYINDNNHLTHKYGPHIFHTNSINVWNYLSHFTEWRPYFHKVLGHIDGQYVPIPFNLNSIKQLFPDALADKMIADLLSEFKFGARVPILDLKKRESSSLQFLAEFIYDKVFLNYTVKQWGLKPEELLPSVTARVPVVIGKDDRYFNDRFQAMPVNGYTKMFQKMLENPLIDIVLNTEWKSLAIPSDQRVIFTGPIDEYFDFVHGELPYRSLNFTFDCKSYPNHQSVGTVNYPNEFTFTRITEQKILTGEKSDDTLLITEYPEAHKRGFNEPYYPVPSPMSSEILSLYQKERARLQGLVWFAGRLGDYSYYNMDQACANALSLFEKQIRSSVSSAS